MISFIPQNNTAAAGIQGFLIETEVHQLIDSIVSIGSLPWSDVGLCVQGLICTPCSELYKPIGMHILFPGMHAVLVSIFIYTIYTMD